MQLNQRIGAELSANCSWFITAHRSQNLLPRWLCLAREDQLACAGVVLCWGHPSVSMENLSGMPPLLLPPHYPHQAKAATNTRKPQVIRKELDNGTETSPGWCLDDAVVAKPHCLTKLLPFYSWIWTQACNHFGVWPGLVNNLGVRVPTGPFKGNFMQLACLYNDPDSCSYWRKEEEEQTWGRMNKQDPNSVPIMASLSMTGHWPAWIILLWTSVGRKVPHERDHDFIQGNSHSSDPTVQSHWNPWQ